MTRAKSLTNPIAVTLGDPGGIAPEITAQSWQVLKDAGPTFFVCGAPDCFANLSIPTLTIAEPEDAASVFDKALPVLELQNPVVTTLGKSCQENATAILESIQTAVNFCLEGKASAIVTNPIQKATLLDAGFEFPGHTEFLGELTKATPMPENRQRGPVMMLASPALKTVPVTIHQSVRAAAKALSKDVIIHAARITHEALQYDFGVPKPRLAISGLNPHAGENGAFGTEEIDTITPAIEALQKGGVNAFGPLSADALFHEEARRDYDAALCMLHDQALIPVKTIAFHDGVNVTLGLPIIRTSPDHGVALAIAGQGKARADSMIASIKLAATLAANRL